MQQEGSGHPRPPLVVLCLGRLCPANRGNESSIDATTVGAVLASPVRSWRLPESSVRACVATKAQLSELVGWEEGAFLLLPPVNSSLTHEQSINRSNQINQLINRLIIEQSRSTRRSGTLEVPFRPPAQAPAFSRETQFYTLSSPYTYHTITILTGRICPPSDGRRLAQRQLLSHFLVPRAPAQPLPRSPHSSVGSKTQFPWKPFRPSLSSRIILYEYLQYVLSLGRPHSCGLRQRTDGQQTARGRQRGKPGQPDRNTLAACPPSVEGRSRIAIHSFLPTCRHRP